MLEAVQFIVTVAGGNADNAALNVGINGVTPVPDNAAVCVLFALPLPSPLSVTTKFPPTEPAVVGLKVTLIVQFAPAANDVPQLFVAENLAGGAMLAIANGAFPLLANVTGCEALVVPTNTFPKGTGALRTAIGAALVPVSDTV